MSALLKLSALAMRGLVFGACQAIGMEAGEKAVEPVSRFLEGRFASQGERLVRALAKVNARAWDTLEYALAGESLWQRCTTLFARPDDRLFREQVRAFLDGLPPGILDAEGPEFRHLALAELRLARQEGALRVSALDVRQVAYHAGRFAGFANPQTLLAAEQQALAEIAASFPGDRYAHLRRLLEVAPSNGPPLLTAAARYFLRREIELDRELFQGLAFTLLEQQGAALEAGLRHLDELLTRHAIQFTGLLTDVLQLTTQTHDEVVKINARLEQLLARHHLAGRELRPDDTLMTISEDERRLIRELVRAYRALPDAQRAERLELAFKIGQAEAITGDFAEAKRAFDTAARLAPEPSLRAEAHASAYQAALAQNDLDSALASLLDAARVDPARFTPFPLDKYRPERILGAGGFGTAFLCRHAFQRNAVVVKSLWTAGLDRSIDDVFNEAQVLAGLTHPVIIPVLDCDYADRERRQRPYVVMDFFDGLSLASRVAAHGPLTRDDFLAVAKQLATGLQAAHERGVYHRDVKPANVLVRPPAGVSEGWLVRLIDFGLALRPATLAVTRLGSEHTRRTLVGNSIAGTYKYAAPEQLGDLPGVVVGPYSDVYSFGRTAYFALLGTPEPDDDEKDLLSDPWRKLLSRCTARMPARRPQSFNEILLELEKLGGGHPPIPAPTPAKSIVLPALESLKPLPPPLPEPVRPSRPTRPARPHGSPLQPGCVRATCIATLAAHEGTVSAVAFRPDGRILATGGFDDRVRLWSLPGAEMLVSLDAHAADVNGLAFRRDGSLLASAGDDRDVRLWHVPGGQSGPVLRHPDRVYAVAFSPDGRLLVTGCDDYKARLWSPDTGSTVSVLTGHTSFVRHAAFSPDGRLLATASGDRLVYLWALPEGQRRAALVGHAHTVWCVAFSPDGRLVATASQDRTVRIWNLHDTRPLRTLEGHEDIVWSVAFSPDGRLLASASHDRTVRLWSVQDGRLLATLTGHGGLVRSVAFSPDGRSLATASGDGTARLWLIHDDSERCDWSMAVPDLPPRAQVSVICAGHGIVYPGDEMWVDVQVHNTGRGDLVQLRAVVESEAPLMRGMHALFGRVRPGEKVNRCMGVLLPPDTKRSELRGEVVFQEGNEYHPAPVPVVFQVRELPRDDFHVHWRLVDDGSGNSFGDGDGIPRRGECLDVVVTIENRSGQELEGLLLNLAPIQVPMGVVVNVPRSELPPVPDGGHAEERVTFSVKPSARTGPATFELRVQTEDGRLFAREVVRTEIG